jgi:hypothetical protein
VLEACRGSPECLSGASLHLVQYKRRSSECHCVVIIIVIINRTDHTVFQWTLPIAYSLISSRLTANLDVPYLTVYNLHD